MAPTGLEDGVTGAQGYPQQHPDYMGADQGAIDPEMKEMNKHLKKLQDHFEVIRREIDGQSTKMDDFKQQ